MHCPYCRNTDSRVIDSRTADDGTSIRRRRQCVPGRHLGDGERGLRWRSVPDIVGVQPMTGPVGEIFKMRCVYGNHNHIKEQ